MGWERARQGQETQDEFGLAASGCIPVASAGQIDAGYCLRFLRRIRDCSFATVDAEGLPAVCPQGCVARVEDGTFRIDQGACLRCGLCEEACPHGAIFRSAGCADGWTRENRASTWCSTFS